MNNLKDQDNETFGKVRVICINYKSSPEHGGLCESPSYKCVPSACSYPKWIDWTTYIINAKCYEIL